MNNEISIPVYEYQLSDQYISNIMQMIAFNRRINWRGKCIILDKFYVRGTELLVKIYDIDSGKTKTLKSSAITFINNKQYAKLIKN